MSKPPDVAVLAGSLRKEACSHRMAQALAALALFALLAICSAAAQAQRISAGQLVQGTQVGKSLFEPGATGKGGNGQPVDGIEGSSNEMLKTHFHAHLSLFHNGEQIAIPYGIGIVMPHQVKNGFVAGGRGFYWLHTHDATGIIHVESPDERAYTLGNFFDIWGQPLNSKNVAGLNGTVHAFVDGTPYKGKVRDIRLQPHAQITLVVGAPAVTPPRYEFPTGL
jgi:hypothetical protein